MAIQGNDTGSTTFTVTDENLQNRKIRNRTFTTESLYVEQDGIIQGDVVVTFKIYNWFYPDDLAGWLVAPDGTEYSLFQAFKGTQYNNNGTTVKQLSGLAGKSMQGIWGLKLLDKWNDVSDDYQVNVNHRPPDFETGALNGFALQFTTKPIPASYRISDARATERDSLVFTVTRSGNTSIASTVNYAATPGSAKSGSDYTANSGTLSFAARETTKTITIATINDTVSEATETFSVVLSSPNNGGILTNTTGVGTIRDNDFVTTPGNDVVFGTDQDDTIMGLGGNDTLYGYEGYDTIYGDAGDDVIDGGTGGDQLIGGIGNDVYYVDNTGDVVTEVINAGVDTVYSSITYTLKANVENLTLLNPAINGTGNTLNNVIIGNGGANILDGGAGNDTIYGGAGNDTIIYGTGDKVDGGSGLDVLDASRQTSGVSIAGYTGVEVVYGGSGKDTVSGSSGNELIDGKGGNDTIYGGAGNDTIIYGAGDKVDGGTGYDILDASKQTVGVNIDLSVYSVEAAYGGTGKDTLKGSIANESFYGGAGNDHISGGIGRDILDGGTGNDTLVGGLGNDSYYIDSVKDIVTESANEGTDKVYSSITYTLGNDIENLEIIGIGNIKGTGNALNNIIIGNSGNNLLDGGLGNDTIYGGAGNDTIIYGIGDKVDGGTGCDVLDARKQTTGLSINLASYSGLEVIYAGSGNDTLYGSNGNDSLIGNSGDDLIDGKGGNDTIVYDTADKSRVTGGTGIDVLTAEKAVRGVTIKLGTVFQSIETVVGSNYSDYLTGDALANTLQGGLGNDTLDGGSGNDFLEGGAGNDWVIASSATTRASGGNGIDTLDMGRLTANLTVNLTTSYIDFENLYGGSGKDSLTGNAVDNILSGGGGNDWLSGGKGNDLLMGGAGNDTFVYAYGFGNDTIDFSKETGIERVNIDGEFNPSKVTRRRNGNDIVLSFGTGMTLTLGKWDNDLDRRFNSFYFASLDDTLNLDEDIRWMRQGNDGNDLFVSRYGEKLYGLGGADTLRGFYGSTLLGDGIYNYYGDWLLRIKDTGDNYIDGGDGADYISGGGGNDTLIGGSGDDIIYGGYGKTSEGIDITEQTGLSDNGNNLLYGGAGNDWLMGDKGNDTLSGGAGKDKYVYKKGDGRDVIVSDAANVGDSIHFQSILGSEVSISQNSENLVLSVGGGSLTVQGWYLNKDSRITDFWFDDDKLGIDADNHWMRQGNDGNDVFVSRYGEKLYGLGGADTLRGFYGSTLLGDGLFDYYGYWVLRIKDTGDNYIDGGDGADYISGGGGNDTLIGGSGDDIIYGGYGKTSEGYDITEYTGLSDNGNDWLNGGKGNDTLSGGAGSDVYVFDSDFGADLIVASVDNYLDRVSFQSSAHTAANISYGGVGGDDLILKLGSSSTLTIADWKQGSSYQINCFVFTDGSYSVNGRSWVKL